MAPMAEYTATDTCSRCGLNRLTKTLEEKGITIRLCDDCYWGRESPEPAVPEPAGRVHSATTRILWDALDDLSTLRESVDVLLEAPYACRWRARVLATRQPAVDIFETEHALIVRTEFPRVNAKNVEITVAEKTLTIKSRSPFGPEPRQEAFIRTVALPCAVKRDQTKIAYRYGILEVWLPKARLSNVDGEDRGSAGTRRSGPDPIYTGNVTR